MAQHSWVPRRPICLGLKEKSQELPGYRRNRSASLTRLPSDRSIASSVANEVNSILSDWNQESRKKSGKRGVFLFLLRFFLSWIHGFQITTRVRSRHFFLRLSTDVGAFYRITKIEQTYENKTFSFSEKSCQGQRRSSRRAKRLEQSATHADQRPVGRGGFGRNLCHF